MRRRLALCALPALGTLCLLTPGCSESMTNGQAAADELDAAPYFQGIEQGYVGVKTSTSPLESQIRFMRAEQNNSGGWQLKEQTAMMISLAGTEVVDFLVEDLDDDKDLDDIAALMRVKNNASNELRIYWACDKSNYTNLDLLPASTPVSIGIAQLNDDALFDLVVLTRRDSNKDGVVSVYPAVEQTDDDGVRTISFPNRLDFDLTGFEPSSMAIGAGGSNIIVRSADSGKFPGLVRNRGVDPSGQWLGLEFVQ